MINDMDLTLQGDDMEPLVCSVCGSTDAGAGELNKGVFTCWECIKKKHETTPLCMNGVFLGFGPARKLDEMMAMQADFNRKVGHIPYVGKGWKPNMKWLQKWLTCISQEVAECRDWTAWKTWSKRSGNKLVEEKDLYNEAHIKEIKLELIDIMHFLLSACLELRMDADEVYALYCEKMQVNHDRQEGDY